MCDESKCWSLLLCSLRRPFSIQCISEINIHFYDNANGPLCHSRMLAIANTDILELILICFAFKQVVNSDNPVIVNFHADWCDPCKSFNFTFSMRYVISFFSNDFFNAIHLRLIMLLFIFPCGAQLYAQAKFSHQK